MPSPIRIFILVALLLGAAISAQAQSSSPGGPTAGSSISGRVTLGGKPMPGLVISVQRDGSGNSSSEPAAKATTDEDGRYRIAGLAPGNYRITSLSAVYPGIPSSGKTITLSQNEQAENVDFSIVRGAVITGKVTDADGRPLIGEHVTLNSIDNQGSKRSLVPVDPTTYEIDDRGVYRVFGLPAGRYTVSAGQATTSLRIGLSGPTYRRTFYPNATEEEQAKIIELKESQEAANIDINVGRPVKTFEASGHVINAETGQPMANVMFGYGSVREGRGAPPDFGTSGIPTDVRGEFRIDSLLPGGYRISLFNNAAPGQSEDAGIDYYNDPLTFEISESNVSGLELKVHRACSITGVIAAEDGNDQALLSQASQTVVFALPVGGGTSSGEGRWQQAWRLQVQPDGSFRVGSLLPGKVHLSLNSPGLQLIRVEREGGAVSDYNIELAPGEQVTGVRLIVSYGTGAVRGEVKITGGTLPEGSTLLILTQRLSGTAASTAAPIAPVEADARGRFVIEKLAPGEYELTAQVISAAGRTPPTPRTSFPSVKQNVTVTNGAETQVALTLDLSVK